MKGKTVGIIIKTVDTAFNTLVDKKVLKGETAKKIKAAKDALLEGLRDSEDEESDECVTPLQ